MDNQYINNNLADFMLSLLSLPENEVSKIIKFMDEMPGGFFIYHADGDEQIIYANAALLRIFQCSTMDEFKELTGNSFRGMVHHDDLEAVEKSINEQISNSQYNLDYVEYRIVRKDGTIRWLEDYGHFIHSESAGDIFYVFVGDATEKKNQQKLISQEYLRRLEVIKGLSVNYESILYVDLEKDEVLPYRLSARTKRQFGRELRARKYLDFITSYINTWVHPEDRQMLSQSVSLPYIRAKLLRAKSYSINYRILTGEESTYLQLRIVNVSNSRHISQIIMGYRGIDEDIQREMEQKKMLEEALHSANLAIAAKQTFLSNISHDMRTPLNAILGYTALAKEYISDSNTVLDYLSKIDTSGRQLLDFIEKVLDVTWTESNDTRISETECSLTAIIQDIYNSFRQKAEEKNIHFSTDLSALTHYDVYGDPEKISHLLRNLVSNAINFTNPGGIVSIAATETKNLASSYATFQFIIKDNGIGISKDFQESLFEPFEREKNTTISGISGSGLGLAIAKNLVDLMGGSIHVDSTVGCGSTFTVTLRLPIQDQPLSADSATEDILTQLLNQKILLVEDNEINLEIETELLSGLGLIIDTAENGKDAIEKVAGSTPNEYSLILMDIQMPIMDGWQAAKAIRELDNPALARIPIIALSANAFESDKRASIESGMNAHLPKPLDIPYLLETVAKILQVPKK
ncbi:MAG: response regulator [Lachnospiraceae bacterium]|nr:response regulator [Lachnospiraceae bacterium]